MEQETNQTGEVKEQPKEEISKEVPKSSPEVKPTSRTEDEFRKIQSMKDKAEATLNKVQTELQELRKATEQQRLLHRQKEITDLEGDADGQAKVRRKHQIEDELNELQNRREKEEGAVQRKYDQARELSRKFSLSLDEERDLLDATTPREMELLAQLKAKEREKIQETKAPTKEVFTPDSGASEGSGESDDAFLKRYSEGKSDDHKRAKKILEKIRR